MYSSDSESEDSSEVLDIKGASSISSPEEKPTKRGTAYCSHRFSFTESPGDEMPVMKQGNSKRSKVSASSSATVSPVQVRKVTDKYTKFDPLPTHMEEFLSFDAADDNKF